MTSRLYENTCPTKSHPYKLSELLFNEKHLQKYRKISFYRQQKSIDSSKEKTLTNHSDNQHTKFLQNFSQKFSQPNTTPKQITKYTVRSVEQSLLKSPQQLSTEEKSVNKSDIRSFKEFKEQYPQHRSNELKNLQKINGFNAKISKEKLIGKTSINNKRKENNRYKLKIQQDLEKNNKQSNEKSILQSPNSQEVYKKKNNDKERLQSSRKSKLNNQLIQNKENQCAKKENQQKTTIRVLLSSSRDNSQTQQPRTTEQQKNEIKFYQLDKFSNLKFKKLSKNKSQNQISTITNNNTSKNKTRKSLLKANSNDNNSNNLIDLTLPTTQLSLLNDSQNDQLNSNTKNALVASNQNKIVSPKNEKQILQNIVNDYNNATNILPNTNSNINNKNNNNLAGKQQQQQHSKQNFDKENACTCLQPIIFPIKRTNPILSQIYQIEEDDEEETEYQEDQYNLFTANLKIKLIDYLNCFSNMTIISSTCNSLLYEKEISYEGDINEEKKQGYGVLWKTTAEEGKISIYEGQFCNDQFHGRGKLTNIYANPNFEGFINFNNLNSLSKYAWIQYQGEFVDGYFDGFGVLLLKNNQKLHAQFQKAVIYGNATVFNTQNNDIIFSGEYENNVLLFKNM